VPKKNGYDPVFYQQETNWRDSYVWSSELVPVEQAQAGDIAQFTGWQEPYLYAWNPHTAIITDFYDAGSDTLTTYQQNPGPVAEAKYHPGQKTSGGITIYRITDRSARLRLYSQTGRLFQTSSGVLSVTAAVGAITGLLAVASVIVVMVKRRRSGAQNPETIECEAMLDRAMNPETGEAQNGETLESEPMLDRDMLA